MGKLEKLRSSPIAKIILQTIDNYGEMIPRMIAPNARKNFRLFRERGSRKSFSPSYINKSVERFVRLGYLEHGNDGGHRTVSLTAKGKFRLSQFRLNDLALHHKKKWDNKWRIIIFDISEEKRNFRDILRDNLIRIGFEKLQHSVWIYPYECEELIHLIKTDFKLGEDVLYIIADHLENEEKFTKIFGL